MKEEVKELVEGRINSISKEIKMLDGAVSEMEADLVEMKATRHKLTTKRFIFKVEIALAEKE